jgi:OmpA-OmpF porin, OOP family
MNSKLMQLRAAAAAALLVAAPGLAAADTITGMIVSHEGDKLVVQVGGSNTTVMLTPTTSIQTVSGPFGRRREDHPASDLINGLAVNIDTVQNGEEIDAARVTFKPDDLKVAMAIAAGTEQAKQRFIAEQAQNEKRLSQVGQFDTKGSVRVLFATGSTAITARGRQDLEDIVRQAQDMPGYLLRVVGHADTTGSPALNQRLSDQRASAVTAYLLAYCHVPPDKMMSSTGLGSTLPLDTDNSAAGNAENRRVTVFILVSKASEGPSSLP